MILELLTYLTTPCPPAFRRLGYLRESIATHTRSKRQKVAWAPHLENNRRVIAEAVDRVGRGRTALVFGGGLVNDLPLEALSRAFERVLLVDVVHLRAARARFRQFGNIGTVTHDVTESVDSVLAGRPVAAEPSRFLDDPTVDLVVSAGVISQLPIMPGQYLEYRLKVAEPVVEAFNAALIRAHLDYLQRFSCPVCLIADVTRELFDAKGQPVTTISALWEVELPWEGEEWDWHVEPLGEAFPDYSVVNRVRGIVDIASAQPADYLLDTPTDEDES